MPKPTDPAWLQGYSDAMEEAASLANFWAAIARMDAQKLTDIWRADVSEGQSAALERLAQAYGFLATNPRRNIEFDDATTKVGT